MKAKSKNNWNLDDLLYLKLKALYDVENELVKALPKMAKNAIDVDLKEGFQKHLRETENQVKRLEKAFDLIGQKKAKTKVEAIRGIVSDGKWLMTNIKDKKSIDSALISAGAYVEHYEIAGYMSAIRWAKLLGYTEIEDLLSETLNEEIMADQKLTWLANSKIDERAMAEESQNNQRSQP